MGRETVDKHMDKKSNSFAESSNGSSSDDKNVQLPSAEVKECTDQQNTSDTPDSKKKLNSSSSSLKTRASSRSPTVLKPFSLSAEKPVSSVSPGNAASHNSSSASRGSQPNSPLPARKTTTDHKKHHDEEDSFSVASSSATSTRTIKPKLTVGVAPTFRSSVRLERRKEFYQKLEEKQKALEEEKRENEKRLKEEQELVTKQLRKNMAYKANPVPNFYYEAPPPKTPLKKFPLTRPKSPNLNRRKSCSSTVNSSYQEVKGKHCDRHRHSVDGCKEEPKTSNGARSPNMTRKFTKETSKSEEVNGKNKVRHDGEKSENGA